MDRSPLETLVNFLDCSPTAFHAVHNAAAMLSAHGFTALSEGEEWHPEHGRAYYVTRGGSALIAFRIGNKTPESAFRIVASHTDSPALKLKENPALSDGTFTRLNVEPYGGGIFYSFLDRPLTIAGRIVREKETGTMEVLLASPMKPAQIILSKMAPYFVISVTNLITILLIATFIMDVPIRGSLFWLSVVSLCFVFVALALGLLISTIVDTQMAALLVSGIGLMMPVMIFSGLIFPLESMPWGLRWISDIIPARWYISAVRKIMIEGVGVEYFAKELGIIILMAVFLMAVAWKKFKIRLS